MQSAQEQELKILGRIHDFDGFCQVYREAVEAGFTNINVDVMSGLPGQTLASYKDTLEKVLRLEPMPQHISAYSLIVEEGTSFAAMADRGELPLPEEDTERAMYEETIEVLAGYGFHRYEISNYALDGYECRHNVGYWIRRDYLGFGIGAASLIGNVRFQNGRDLNAYLAHPFVCREEEQSLTTQEQMEETMFLGLRLIRGVSYTEFARCYGQTLEEVYGEVIARNVADGLLTVREDETGRRLTLMSWHSFYSDDPRGTDRHLWTENHINYHKQLSTEVLFEDLSTAINRGRRSLLYPYAQERYRGRSQAGKRDSGREEPASGGAHCEKISKCRGRYGGSDFHRVYRSDQSGEFF